jgi:hypothetical protein
VAYAAVGFAPRRFQVRRVADEDFLLADATLQHAAERLETVRVTAPRGRVGRGEAQADVGGTERRVDPSLLAPEQMGDLAAIAAAMPGVTPVPGADGDPGRLLGARPLPRPEPDDAQRDAARRRRPAARRDVSTSLVDLAVRRLERGLQRRPPERAGEPRHQLRDALGEPRSAPRPRCSGPTAPPPPSASSPPTPR